MTIKCWEWILKWICIILINLTQLQRYQKICLLSLKSVFPQFSTKFLVIKNISSVSLIHKLADEYVKVFKAKLNLLTIGRLSVQKGYDLLLSAAKILNKKEIDFSWICIGEGEFREELNKQVIELKFTKKVHFIGLEENKYPFIKIVIFTFKLLDLKGNRSPLMKLRFNKIPKW